MYLMPKVLVVYKTKDPVYRNIAGTTRMAEITRAKMLLEVK